MAICNLIHVSDFPWAIFLSIQRCCGCCFPKCEIFFYLLVLHYNCFQYYFRCRSFHGHISPLFMCLCVSNIINYFVSICWSYQLPFHFHTEHVFTIFHLSKITFPIFLPISFQVYFHRKNSLSIVVFPRPFSYFPVPLGKTHSQNMFLSIFCFYFE